MVDQVEKSVAFFYLLGQGCISALSMVLFVSAGLGVLIASLLLLRSASGLGKAGETWSIGGWSPWAEIDLEHYGVSLVNALEVAILAITLYLFGLGVASMLRHPRLQGIPGLLRYLEHPERMKRMLAVAIAVLLAVEGLKTVLEVPKAGVPLSDLIAMGVRVAATGILLLGIILLVRTLSAGEAGDGGER